MNKELNISLEPKLASDECYYRPIVALKLGIKENEITLIRVIRKSIDARQRMVKINLGVVVYWGESAPKIEKPVFKYENVAQKDPVVIVGAGPAGLFAALRFIELGMKPIIVERGKAVNDRKKDIAAIYQEHIINPDSNYGFGEGGAGTFSDGKLYTRSKKRGDIKRILEVFHYHGAQDEILIDAHPHIGTNVLPRVISKIRESILNAGGEILFNSRVIDFTIHEGRVCGVELKDGSRIDGKAVVLATGHSARDIYELLHRKGITLEAKSFAMGVRVEHPQEIIDTIQYHRPGRGKYLPAAAYSFAEQVEGRGVYSFCMCPGGVIVPAATAPGEHVVNGMSPSGRNTPFANSGMVVEIRTEDLKDYGQYETFAGLEFQRQTEQLSFRMAGKTQFAPGQRLVDFLDGRLSATLPRSSFRPGVVSSPMHEWLPSFIRQRLQIGFKQIARKSSGFVTNEAMILGVESRTSSPVRIPRNESTLEHIHCTGLFPCGEGAGYAGGIVSSAVDGERCAEQVYSLYGRS
ncbi:MAG: FAD-binding protein [Bacteroidota bacterium]|nr:FAD-binding protein [Bacteroidota bacterium]